MEKEREAPSLLRRLPFGRFLEDALSPLRAAPPDDFLGWLPGAGIRETDKEYIIEISLPGVLQEDVKVEVKDEVLTVRGEKKSEREEKGDTWLRRESIYGSFLQTYELPRGLQTEDVKACHKRGVLTLTMRKRAQAQVRGAIVKID